MRPAAPARARLVPCRYRLEQLHLLRDFENLNKQTGQLVKKAPAKGGQGVVVGMRAGRNEAEGHRVIRRPLDFSAGKHASGVAIDQQRQQHRRVIGGTAAPTIERKSRPSSTSTIKRAKWSWGNQSSTDGGSR